MRAGKEVLMEVGCNILMIFGDPHGIFDQQLRPRPIHLFNITTITLIKY
jgi:hypothetical protein